MIHWRCTVVSLLRKNILVKNQRAGQKLARDLQNCTWNWLVQGSLEWRFQLMLHAFDSVKYIQKLNSFLMSSTYYKAMLTDGFWWRDVLTLDEIDLLLKTDEIVHKIVYQNILYDRIFPFKWRCVVIGNIISIIASNVLQV